MSTVKPIPITRGQPHEDAENEESTKKFLMSDETYTLLIQAQSKIKEATEVTPTLRKLINELVTHDAVEQLTQKLIAKLT